jgi:hypothetical protein
MLSRASTSYGQPQPDPWQELAPPPASAWSAATRVPPRNPTLPYAVPRRGKRVFTKLLGTVALLGGVFFAGVFSRDAVERKAGAIVDGLPLGLGDVIREQTSWKRAQPAAPVVAAAAAPAPAAPAPVAQPAPSVTPLPASASEPVRAAPPAPTVEQLPSADKPTVAAKPPAVAKVEVAKPREPVEALPAAVVAKAAPPVAAKAEPTRASRHAHASRSSSRAARVALAAPARSTAKAAKGTAEADEAPKVAKADKPERSEKPVAAEEPAPPRAAEPADPLEKLMAGAVSTKKSSRREAKSVEEALAGSGGARETAAPIPAALQTAAPKKTLTRDQIVQALRSVQGDVDECAKRFHKTGGADVEIAVDRDGTVQKAKATGANAGTPIGKCLEDAVSSADFPTSDGMKFPYRLTLR